MKAEANTMVLLASRQEGRLKEDSFWFLRLAIFLLLFGFDYDFDFD